MRWVFADTGYWIALLNVRDRLHASATAVAGQFDEYGIVTSEVVLIETLNAFSDCGPYLRLQAVEWAQATTNDPGVEVVPQSFALFRTALALYRDRPDKDWSLTDYASFAIMEQRHITEALTQDRHFEQNGYRALLRGANSG